MTKYATIEKTLPQIGREYLVTRKDEGVGMWKAAYKKARETVDLANLRTAYAECSAEANAGVLDYKAVCQKVMIKQVAKGDTIYVIVNLDGSTPTFTTKRPSGIDAKSLFE